MNALVKAASLPAATTSEASASEVIAFLQMIERASKDPKINIDKLQRLLDMRQQEYARIAVVRYHEAMTACQAEMEPIRADCANDQTRSRYASLAAVIAVTRPIYTKHGFWLNFDTADSPKPDHVRVVCKVGHQGGHTEVHHIDMPVDGKGARGGDVMTKTHAMGSGVTYGRRYLYGMVFDLAVERDDDGNAAGRRRAAPPARPPVEDHAAAERAQKAIEVDLAQDFLILKDELVRNGSEMALKQWGVDNQPRIDKQPVGRRNLLRQVFLAKLSELRTRPPSADSYPKFDPFDELPDHSAPPKDDGLDVPTFLKRSSPSPF